MSEKKGYPRKVLVMSTIGLVERTVNDALPGPAPLFAIFQAGGWTTSDMRMQAFQALNPYMLPNEDLWVFGYHHGKYQAKKARWPYGGYASASWSDLLAQIVRYYYTYA